MIAEQLLCRLEGVRETGQGRWLARCPAHEDKSPSLSIRDLGDRVLIHDFGGCDALEVVQALGLQLADLFTDRSEHRYQPNRSRIPAGDALAAIDREALTVAVIAADIHKHREIDDATMDRLLQAIKRIGAARDCIAGWRRR